MSTIYFCIFQKIKLANQHAKHHYKKKLLISRKDRNAVLPAQMASVQTSPEKEQMVFRV
jgi:hypothetical protein